MILKKGSVYIVAMLLLFSACESKKAVENPAEQAGPLAPDFSLKTLNGEDFQLSSLRGKGVLINFWATWCPPCRAEIPMFQNYYEKYKDKDFVIVGVSMDNNAELARRFMENFGVTYINVLGDRKVATQYNARGLPTSYILDKKGRVIQMYLGKPKEAQLEKDIQKALDS